MNERELITQLKILRKISPDREWADLLRVELCGPSGPSVSIFERIFTFSVPKYLAIPSMAAIVALFGGLSVFNAGIADLEIGNSPALTASLKHVSSETALEVSEVQRIAEKIVLPKREKSENSAHTVVFDKDAEERENFQALLRERIVTKIAYVKDLFEQAEDGNSVREILQNQRRYEENFKIFGEGLDGQVKVLLDDAEKALSEGDLITALDLVNAIEKLIKS